MYRNTTQYFNGNEMNAYELMPAAAVLSSGTGLQPIADAINEQLNLRFSDPNDPGLYTRRIRLRNLFQAVPAGLAGQLLIKLQSRQDPLGRLFWYKLSSVTCNEMIGILQSKLNSQPVPPVVTTPAPPIPVPPVIPPVGNYSMSKYELDTFIQKMSPYLFYLRLFGRHYKLSDILSWIKIESGGINDDRATSSIDLNERGFFQISKDESASLQFNHPMISQDPYYSLQCGITLMNKYASLVTSYGYTQADEVFIKLVKFCHAAGTGSFKGIMRKLQQQGKLPGTWNEFRAFVLNPANDIGAINRFMKNAVRFTNHIDKFISYSRQIAQVV